MVRLTLILSPPESQIKNPALEKTSRTGHPKFTILTWNGRMGVVLDLGFEATLWNAKGPVTRPVSIYLTDYHINEILGSNSWQLH